MKALEMRPEVLDWCQRHDLDLSRILREGFTVIGAATKDQPTRVHVKWVEVSIISGHIVGRTPRDMYATDFPL